MDVSHEELATRRRDVRISNSEGVDVSKASLTGAFRYIVAAFDPSILSSTGGYLDDGDLKEESRVPHSKSQVSN